MERCLTSPFERTKLGAQIETFRGSFLFESSNQKQEEHQDEIVQENCSRCIGSSHVCFIADGLRRHRCTQFQQSWQQLQLQQLQQLQLQQLRQRFRFQQLQFQLWQQLQQRHRGQGRKCCLQEQPDGKILPEAWNQLYLRHEDGFHREW